MEKQRLGEEPKVEEETCPSCEGPLDENGECQDKTCSEYPDTEEEDDEEEEDSEDDED